MIDNLKLNDIHVTEKEMNLQKKNSFYNVTDALILNLQKVLNCPMLKLISLQYISTCF